MVVNQQQDASADHRTRPGADHWPLLSTDLKWMFGYCERISCGHSMPIALAPFAIRWGMDASTDLIRERLRCSKCGAKGVALKRPSWNARWPAPNGNSVSHTAISDLTDPEETK